MVSALTTEELNYLIFRYLEEAGFKHSSFTFSHEAQLSNTKIDHEDVPIGLLVKLIQKGLQYTEIEEHLEADGSLRACDEPFTATGQHTCKKNTFSSD